MISLDVHPLSGASTPGRRVATHGAELLTMPGDRQWQFTLPGVSTRSYLGFNAMPGRRHDSWVSPGSFGVKWANHSWKANEHHSLMVNGTIHLWLAAISLTSTVISLPRLGSHVCVCHPWPERRSLDPKGSEQSTSWIHPVLLVWTMCQIGVNSHIFWHNTPIWWQTILEMFVVMLHHAVPFLSQHHTCFHMEEHWLVTPSQAYAGQSNAIILRKYGWKQATHLKSPTRSH